jgi:mono/diheme cytochrome c family protein
MWVTRTMASLACKLGWLGLCVAVGQASGGGLARADSNPAKADAVAMGIEIFNREWMPNDPRGHGGDGLGPVYNESSCVACHNSDGSGGAGPVSKNIDILSASRNLAAAQVQGSTTAISSSPTAAIDPLLEVHAGFRTSRSVVLHKFGTGPNYDSWRSQVLRPSGLPDPGAMRTDQIAAANPWLQLWGEAVPPRN